MIPGEYFIKDARSSSTKAGKGNNSLTVANSGDRPIQVGSHYHFFETNPALNFDTRGKARGIDPHGGRHWRRASSPDNV